MYTDIYICIVNILRDLSHHGILMSSWDTKYSLILYRVPIASTILPVKCSTSILQHNTTTTSTPLPQSAHHRHQNSKTTPTRPGSAPSSSSSLFHSFPIPWLVASLWLARLIFNLPAVWPPHSRIVHQVPIYCSHDDIYHALPHHHKNDSQQKGSTDEYTPPPSATGDILYLSLNHLNC